MYTLENVLASFALAGLLLSAVITYLKVNKIWSRKHHREVAESISITAALLSLFTTLPFLLKFLVVDRDFVAAGRFFLSLLGFFVFFLVGIGLWVARDERRNLWSLLMRSLNMERAEMGYLVRTLKSPREARPVIRVLQSLACADENLDPRERDIVESVARSLGVEPDSILHGEHPDLEAGREAFAEFLALKPAQERVARVLDLARMLARADKDVSPAERTLLAELVAPGRGGARAHRGEAPRGGPRASRGRHRLRRLGLPLRRVREGRLRALAQARHLRHGRAHRGRTDAAAGELLVP